MHIMMPRPTIKCSKCGSTDIVIPARTIPEWPANSPVAQPSSIKHGDVELRCKGCGHEKRHEHRDWVSGMSGGTLGYTVPKEETF